MNHPLALVTGATGFIGQHLVRHLQTRGWRIRAALRSPQNGPWDEAWVVGDLAHSRPDWSAACTDVECVFHLAARVHVLHESAEDAEAAYRQMNTVVTEELLHAAQACAVKRFALVSTAKVLGEETQAGAPFTEASIPSPAEAYARSKFAAESRVLAAQGIEAFVLRPPLVYGPGVGANFARMIRWIRSGIWLPLGAIENRRSLVFVGNLVDALAHLALAPGVGGRVFHVSDGAAVSTPELLAAVASACGRAPRLVKVPPALLKAALRLLGRGAEAQRLSASLVLDDSVLRCEFGWSPPFDFAEGLRLTLAAPQQSLFCTKPRRSSE